LILNTVALPTRERGSTASIFSVTQMGLLVDIARLIYGKKSGLEIAG